MNRPRPVAWTRFLPWDALALVVAVPGIVVVTLWQRYTHLPRTARGLIGHSEAEVRRTLGPPRFELTAASLRGRSVDYPWKGMNFVPAPQRAVRNKVLLYSEGWTAVYIYVDEDRRVGEVAVAGT